VIIRVRVLRTLSAPVPGNSGFRHIDGLLDNAIRSVGAPAGLDAAPPVVAQQLLLDWLVAVKSAGMLPGIDFGPISTNPTITAPRSHPAILFYPSGDTGIVDPRIRDPLLDTGQAGAVGEVLDIPTMFAIVDRSFKHALPTFNQWLAGLKIPVTDAGELQAVSPTMYRMVSSTGAGPTRLRRRPRAPRSTTGAPAWLSPRSSASSCTRRYAC
jgi:hypothetical protein